MPLFINYDARNVRCASQTVWQSTLVKLSKIKKNKKNAEQLTKQKGKQIQDKNIINIHSKYHRKRERGRETASSKRNLITRLHSLTQRTNLIRDLYFISILYY